MLKKSALFFSLFALIIFLGLFSQSSALPQETESKVPELSAMHDVIYPIWHTAYPEKDYAALRKYAPEVNSLADKVYTAKLPGILRDKQAKWNEGVAELRKSVDDYLTAAAGTNDEALWNAAEVLHAKYEMLVRVIRPVLKEVDEFHKVLYVVYHKYMPHKEYESIKGVSGDFVQKAEAVAKTALPKRLESRKDMFAAAALELHQAALELAETCLSGHPEAIEGAVEKLHTKYQNLEKVFE